MRLQCGIDGLLKIREGLGPFQQFAIDQKGGCGTNAIGFSIGNILVDLGGVSAIIEAGFKLCLVQANRLGI